MVPVNPAWEVPVFEAGDARCPEQFFLSGRGLSAQQSGHHRGAAVDVLNVGSAAKSPSTGCHSPEVGRLKSRTATCAGRTVCPTRRRCALTTARRRVGGVPDR